MYHQVTDQEIPGFRKYTVTPQAFTRQMDWLARVGYVPITLESLLGARADGGGLPARPVIITFDDGFEDCFRHAVPVLAEHGFTATFYLVAGLMGQRSRWLLQERGFEFPLMSWTQARELERCGLNCGSHTMSHPHLPELSADECRQELVCSRETLEDQLGHAVQHLAYPFGSRNTAVKNIAAEAGYRSACSVRVGLSGADDDALALHRVHVTGFDSLLDFICRLRTAHAPRELISARVQQLYKYVRPTP